MTIINEAFLNCGTEFIDARLAFALSKSFQDHKYLTPPHVALAQRGHGLAGNRTLPRNPTEEGSSYKDWVITIINEALYTSERHTRSARLFVSGKSSLTVSPLENQTRFKGEIHTDSELLCSLKLHPIWQKIMDASAEWPRGELNPLPRRQWAPEIFDKDLITIINKVFLNCGTEFIDARLFVLSKGQGPSIPQLNKTLVDFLSSTRKNVHPLFKYGKMNHFNNTSVEFLPQQELEDEEEKPNFLQVLDGTKTCLEDWNGLVGNRTLPRREWGIQYCCVEPQQLDKLLLPLNLNPHIVRASGEFPRCQHEYTVPPLLHDTKRFGYIGHGLMGNRTPLPRR
ncbi:hypothetical protein C8R46DRAFT_1030244 [Mycena filopes]|nr:hypothetical protein C8R46DRAFT_1030244 [Mycena filopes]